MIRDDNWDSIWEQYFQRQQQDDSSSSSTGPMQRLWRYFGFSSSSSSSSRGSGTHDTPKSDISFRNSETLDDINNEQGVDRSTLPIAYRYYSRKFSRPTTAGSIPLVIFGPNADHWKVTAQQLQQRGFSVIACERVKEPDTDTTPLPNDEELLQTMLRLLHSLRWQQAVLVACDDESLAAIQLAWRLAPDRIAGLILTGDLVEPTDFAMSLFEPSFGIFALDAFLLENLPCPFLIIWNGDRTDTSDKSSRESNGFSQSEISLLQANREKVLGGGTAPHRRRPEQLAWVITRFIEMHLAQAPVVHRSSEQSKKNQNEEQRIVLPLGLDVIFSQEFFVVFGRLFATGIAYGIILRVGTYQYHSFRSGIFDFQTRLQYILSTLAGVFGWFPHIMGRMFQSREKENSETLSKVQEEKIAIKKNGNDSVDNDLTDKNQTDTSEEESMGEAEEEEDPIAEDKIKYGPFFYLDKVVV
jgi:pimeloyl-ACP methyl ester carboxylesterase